MEEHFSRLKGRRCQLCLDFKPRVLIGLFKGCSSRAKKANRPYLSCWSLYPVSVMHTCIFIAHVIWVIQRQCGMNINSISNPAACHCLFRVIKSVTDQTFSTMLHLIHNEVMKDLQHRKHDKCIDLKHICAAHTHTHVHAFWLTSGPTQLKTRWHVARGNILTTGSTAQLMKWWLLYIYLKVIRIQGPRSRIPPLLRLSKEHSFSLVYITKRKMKSCHRSPQA